MEDLVPEMNDFKKRIKPAYIFLKRLAGYIPLSLAGLILSLGLGAAVYFRGVHSLDMVALAAGGGLLTVLGIAIICVLTGTFLTRRQLAQTETSTFLELVSGREIYSGFELANWWYLPLVHVSWDVKEFGSTVRLEHRQGRLKETLNCGRRGLTDVLTRCFTVTDTLGLSSVTWEVQTQGQVRVLPNPGRLEQPNILLSLISGEDISDPRGDPQGDRVDMRQYQKGDPMKFILWKVYSRSGKVMVRVPERALAARPRACCYLMSGEHDEASAALARVLVEMRMLGSEWRLGANGTNGHTSSVEDALNFVARSGNDSTTDCEALKHFLVDAEKDGYGFCLVLAPPGSKALARKVSACVSSSRMRSEIWIGLDVVESKDGGWFKNFHYLDEGALSPNTIHQDWAGQATLVERESGRVMARTGNPR